MGWCRSARRRERATQLEGSLHIQFGPRSCVFGGESVEDIGMLSEKILVIFHAEIIRFALVLRADGPVGLKLRAYFMLGPFINKHLLQDIHNKWACIPSCPKILWVHSMVFL